MELTAHIPERSKKGQAIRAKSSTWISKREGDDIKSTIQHYVRKEDKVTQKNKMSLSATILKKPANNLYFIEKIKKNCVRNGQRTFLVKWQGFPHRQPIWEPEENIFPNKAIDS